jgi:diguanylate cyclase (GGDEF)-like protein
MANHQLLIVDDDPETIKVMGGILSAEADIRVATCGKDALRLARDWTPDLILLDAEMPEMTGFQVCEILKADPELAGISVIFVTNHSEPAFEVAGLEMGAVDFIAKPFSAARVRARVRAQLRAKSTADELRRHATIDTQTGLSNRRHFDHALEREWLRSRRCAIPVSVMIIDIDQFGPFNERYGYEAGNACLCAVARALELACSRSTDLPARFSGGEFALVLPATDRRGAEHVANRILDGLEALETPHDISTIANQLTVSIGIASHDEMSSCWHEAGAARATHAALERASAQRLLKACANALYVAKRSGGDQARLLDIMDADEPVLARNIEVPQHVRSRAN